MTISVPVSVLSTRSSAKPEGMSAAAQKRWLMTLTLHKESAPNDGQLHQN
jgi:hypothetical protein